MWCEFEWNGMEWNDESLERPQLKVFVIGRAIVLGWIRPTEKGIEIYFGNHEIFAARPPDVIDLSRLAVDG